MSSRPSRGPAGPGRRDLRVAVLSLLALSCALFGTDHTFEDEGRICLFPAGRGALEPFGPGSGSFGYEANAALDVVITMPDCLSGSCSHDEKAACTAAIDGRSIRVRSTASYREQGTTCTADCGFLIARCSTGPLPPGSYEVRHGETTLSLTVPSTAPAPCGGRGAAGP